MKTLLKNFTIVTMNENLDVLKDAHLIVEDGKITDVATGAATGTFDEVIDGQNRQVLMPGLVNTHCHVPMVLMRGYGGGHDLNTWLNQYIFPVEDKLTSQSIRAGTALGVAEMIASGITSFADMYYFCDDMAEVTLEAGLNLNLSRGTTVFTPLDDPAAFAPCQEAIALAEKWNGANNGQIKIDFSIHGEYTSFLSPNLWDYLAGYASEHHLGMHVHVSETKAEHEECKVRHGGLTPLQVLDAHGVWTGTRGMAAHCVWTEPEDWKLMAERGISMLHCPTSNLKLGSGIAPVPSLMAAGVNVTLGRKAGVLAAGWDADLIALDFDRPHLKPCHDVMENLVYSVKSSDVVLNMTGGKILYRDGFFSTLDLDRINHGLEQALPTLFGI